MLTRPKAIAKKVASALARSSAMPSSSISAWACRMCLTSVNRNQQLPGGKQLVICVHSVARQLITKFSLKYIVWTLTREFSFEIGQTLLHLVLRQTIGEFWREVYLLMPAPYLDGQSANDGSKRLSHPASCCHFLNVFDGSRRIACDAYRLSGASLSGVQRDILGGVARHDVPTQSVAILNARHGGHDAPLLAQLRLPDKWNGRSTTGSATRNGAHPNAGDQGGLSRIRTSQIRRAVTE